MSRGVAIALAITALIVVVAALSLYALGPGAQPTPAATASPTAFAATSTASPTASAPASPAAQTAYRSKRFGYALELPPPWHQAICGSSDPGDTRLPANESFTSAEPSDEFIGHAGTANDRVDVRGEDNPQKLSPLDFAARNDPNASLGRPRSVTVDGRPAAELGEAGGELYWYHVAEGDRMYTVTYRSRTSASAADRATMLRIVRSFRFISAAERQALPDPAPIPASAPTARALADMLASAFQQKDATTLERLLAPCVSQAVQNGGGASLPRQRYIVELRAQLANGLTVTVDPNATRADPFGSSDVLVRSRWNATPPGNGAPPPSPGRTIYNVDLRLGQTQGGFYWRGTLQLGLA